MGFWRAAGRGIWLAAFEGLVARMSSMLDTMRLLTETGESPIDFSTAGSMAGTWLAVATKVTSDDASKLSSLAVSKSSSQMTKCMSRLAVSGVVVYADVNRQTLVASQKGKYDPARGHLSRNDLTEDKANTDGQDAILEEAVDDGGGDEDGDARHAGVRSEKGVHLGVDVVKSHRG